MYRLFEPVAASVVSISVAFFDSLATSSNPLKAKVYSEYGGESERFLLKPAISEINECSDKIHIAYETYRTGRKIDKINFIITAAGPLQMLTARQKKRERI